MNNETTEKGKYLVRKISVTKTMRNLPIGKSIKFKAREYGPLSSARSAATRMAQSGEGEWKVTTDDNGTTYTITRLK